MSWTVSSDYASFLATSPMDLVHMVTITRVDGEIERWHDQHDLSISDGTNIFFRGLDRESISPIQYKTGGNVSSTSILLAVTEDTSGVLSVDVITGMYMDAKIEISYASYSDPTDIISKFIGYVSDLSFKTERTMDLEVRSILSRAQREIPVEITETCPAILGDTKGFYKCCVDLTPFTDTFTVGNVTSSTVWEGTFSTSRDDQWYKFGKVTFTSGSLSGLTFDVRDHTSDQISLWATPPGLSPAYGDTGTIIAGCDKRFRTCQDKFSNELNYQGYPFIVQKDQSIRDSQNQPTRAIDYNTNEYSDSTV